MQPFLGQITVFPFNFAPVGWALCQGQILPISQNTALFSLLGTQFGGNGVSNFALPDLRGRAPNGQGQGPGLSPYAIGEQQGAESVALNTATTPPHSHGFRALRHQRHHQFAGGCIAGAAVRDRARRSVRRQYLHRARHRDQPVISAGHAGGRRRPASQQSAAVSDAELVHCADGDLPLSQLVRAARRRARENASMSQPFLGEIEAFPYTFAPRGWAFCAGQVAADQPECGAVLAARHHVRR